MDFFDKFKRFLGLGASQNRDSYEPNDRFWQPPNQHDESEPPFHSFNMFTDPLEIHKYFEQQMTEMFKNFQEFGEHFSHFDFPAIEGRSGIQIEEIPDESTPSGDLREKFLKPSYEKTQDDRTDKDIDGRLDIRDWGSVFRGDPSSAGQPQLVPRTNFFGQSVTTKTIRNPDGSVETHHTVKDSAGNEETKITKKIADKEYTIIKKRDKDGKEEIIENLVNLDEKELDKFFPQTVNPNPQPSIFDRFFN